MLIDDFERARKQLQGILEMFPNSHYAYRILGLAYLGESLFEHAIAAFEKGATITRDSVSIALLAEVYGLSGQHDRARTLMEELEERNKREYVLPTAMAWAYTGLGQVDVAFSWLEKAFEAHTSTLLFLRAGPMFDPLRTDTRFVNLLNRLHLPA
jgi:tetratricopeptide (TPR) repeat protein